MNKSSRDQQRREMTSESVKRRRGRPTARHWRDAGAKRSKSSHDAVVMVEDTLREIRSRPQSREPVNRMSEAEIGLILDGIRRSRSRSGSLRRPPPPNTPPPELPGEITLPFGTARHGSNQSAPFEDGGIFKDHVFRPRNDSIDNNMDSSSSTMDPPPPPDQFRLNGGRATDQCDRVRDKDTVVAVGGEDNNNNSRSNNYGNNIVCDAGDDINATTSEEEEEEGVVCTEGVGENHVVLEEEEEEDAMATVERLKARLSFMSEELDRVKIAAENILAKCHDDDHELKVVGGSLQESDFVQR